MKENYNYNFDGDYSKIVTLDECRRRAFVNALCVTPSMKEAAIALGVSTQTMYRFMLEENITDDHVRVMRMRFLISKKKITFNYANGTKKIYN